MSDWNKPISIVAWTAFGALGVAIATFLYKDVNHSKDHGLSPASKHRQTNSRGGRKRHNVTQRKQK
jgi:hypothetical protein